MRTWVRTLVWRLEDREIKKGSHVIQTPDEKIPAEMTYRGSRQEIVSRLGQRTLSLVLRKQDSLRHQQTFPFPINDVSTTATMVYVRQEKLPNLKEYKYSGVDHSLLSRYVLKPFYTHVVIKCFPMWMAPNLITLTGFSFVVVNMLTLLWYNPTLDQDCPPWVYASWALGLFLYQTFDAVDGSQA